ncbi:MAG: helix-turn-helix domain-containing protein [Bacteroidota bacterium]
MYDQVDPEDWISQAEAADLRGVSRQAISQLVQKGRFRTLDIGGRTLLLREDVQGYEPDKGGRPPLDAANETDEER